MARRKAHAITGVISSLAIYDSGKRHRKEDWTLFEAVGVAGTGAIFGLLADIIEPALNPRHRKVFHSLVIGGLIVLALSKLKAIRLSPKTEDFLKAALVAYFSHLALDAMSPMGLPFVGLRARDLEL